MATCSNILAWKIPWKEEPGRLQSSGSQWPHTHTILLDTSLASQYLKSEFTPATLLWTPSTDSLINSNPLPSLPDGSVFLQCNPDQEVGTNHQPSLFPRHKTDHLSKTGKSFLQNCRESKPSKSQLCWTLLIPNFKKSHRHIAYTDSPSWSHF